MEYNKRQRRWSWIQTETERWEGTDRRRRMKRCGSISEKMVYTMLWHRTVIACWGSNAPPLAATVFRSGAVHVMGEPACPPPLPIFFCTVMCSIWKWRNFNKITPDKQNVRKGGKFIRETARRKPLISPAGRLSWIRREMVEIGKEKKRQTGAVTVAAAWQLMSSQFNHRMGSWGS